MLPINSIFTAQHTEHKSDGGFTLIEVLMGTAILVMMALIVGQIYFLVIGQITHYREQTVVASLADQYMEIVRNLPYSQVGTLSGNPHGSLPDQPNATTTTVNGNNYSIYYVVTYVDDPADGTMAQGTDSAPNDYKQVKLYIKNTATNTVTDFVTTVVPQGLEDLASGGALAITVFNSVGQPVSGATISIVNNSLNPSIHLTRTSDASGNWTEVGLPDSVNGYHIVVTKNGYSTDQTYPSSQSNPNPIKPDATIANGQITSVSFSIDLLSDLTFNISNQTCSPLAGIGLNLTGSKLIGTPGVLKFNNNYTSNGSGQINLPNIEWDSYNPVLTGNTYMVYGTSPTQQVTILPDTTESFGLILGPQTPNSLLVIVKDASTSNSIEGASVNLQNTEPATNLTQFTGGSMWTQEDWSMGSGQTDFQNPQEYYSDDGNVSDTGTPSGLRLNSFSGVYASSGKLTSSSFDTGTQATSYTTISWQPTSQDPATNIEFQLAANNDDKTWDYTGPDGTANTYYTVSGTNINPIDDNKEYLRYQAFLSTQDTSKTPVLTSVNINYVSGCFTPGQVMFPGLTNANNYQVVVSANGYQSQTISGINISGYGLLQVSLSH